MILQLELTNWMRHESLTVNFTEGVNAIRGSNEAGKSSLIYAMLYAWYGIRAIPLTSSQIATWGKPENSVKVKLTFDHLGVVYVLTRGPSGTELVYPGGTVTNSTEVSKFIIALFGVSQDVALRVLVTNQDDIRLAIAGNSSQLIEDLADVNLLDQLITKVQAFYPNGNTRALDQAVADLTEAVAVVPSVDMEPAEADISARVDDCSRCQGQVERFAQELEAGQAGYDAAVGAINHHRAETAARAIRQQKIQALEKLEFVLHTDIEDIPTLEQKRRDQEIIAGQWRDWRIWMGKPEFKGNRLSTASVDAARQLFDVHYEGFLSERIQKEQVLKHAREHLAGKESCSACGTRYANADEVAARKAAAPATIEAAEKRIKELNALMSENRDEKKWVEDGDKWISKMELYFAPIAGKVRQNTSQFPSTWTWIADPPPDEDTNDYDKRIRNARLKQEHNTRTGTQKVAHDLELAALKGANALALDEESVLVHQATVERFIAVREAHKTALDALEASRAALVSARVRLERLRDSERSLLREHEEKKTVLATTTKLRDDTVKYNSLIKKLREAKPVVVAQLWSLITALISDYFSTIRGNVSLVTRTADGFLVDGKPISSYSGSTIDSLGLAVSWALHKLFVGNVDFLITDEPGRGMDPDRHNNMLGQLTRSDFKQSIVITHNPSVDAYAANIVEL